MPCGPPAAQVLPLQQVVADKERQLEAAARAHAALEARARRFAHDAEQALQACKQVGARTRQRQATEQQ